MKTKKPFELFTDEELDKYRHQFVISTLRRATYRWPWKNLAAKAAKLERGIYKCVKCSERTRNKDKKLDHIHPVVDPQKGFENWTSYIERLLVGLNGWQVLCKTCHDAKTAIEREERKRARKERKDSRTKV